VKKFILSGAVIVAFIVYIWHSHSEQNQTTVTIPTSLQSGSSTNAGQPTSNAASTPTTTSGAYKDGNYTGDSADAFYGNIQVKVTVSGGKITDVIFLDYPSDRGESVHINQQAMPMLKQEAIQAQSAHVDGVSGATDTSQAFIQSLTSALNQAKA